MKTTETNLREWTVGSTTIHLVASTDWQSCSGLTLRQAEDLLDWLEGSGITCREVLWSEDLSSVTVRWRT